MQDAAEWIDSRALLPGEFTADDLRKAVPDCPSLYMPGLAFKHASARGVIRSEYAKRSTTPTRKGSLLCVWTGVTEGVTE